MVESVEYDLTKIIQELKPEIIVVHHPLFDSHQDHKFAALAVFEALKKAGIKDGNLYLYIVAIGYGPYYPYGPIDTIVSLPPFFKHKVLFQKIYSCFLSNKLQKEKFFALEDMHDIRPFPSINGKAGFMLNMAIFNNFIEGVRGFFRGDVSFYHRAVRTNELFFIVPFEDVDSFLK